MFLFVLSILVFSLVLNFFNYEIPSSLWWLNIISCVGMFIYYTIRQKMLKYVLQRTAGAILTVFVIATLTFVLLRVLPGGPFDREKALPPEIKANIEAKYHLDKPLVTQYFYYITGLLKGNLGESYKYIGRNVSDIIKDTLPISLQLGLYALIVAFLLGVPCGVLAAGKCYTWVDRVSMMTAISGVSLPSFLTAPILILIFCFYFNWFEPALWEGPAYYILPLVVLGTRPAGVIARLTRSSMLDVMGSDYVRTARAKGLRSSVVLYKHILKNAFLPVLTLAGPLVAGVLTGSFIVEHIFAVPGMAKHLVSSVSNRDYPLVLGVTLVYATALVFANLLVDMLYSYFDPRIRLSS